MISYQYKYQPVTQMGLNNFVGANVTVLNATLFTIVIQADASQKGDLDAYMTSLGFEYVGEV